MKEGRSSIVPENLQEVLDAAVSPAHALQGNQQQYETPPHIARFINTMLPTFSATRLDPQCANGNVFNGLYTPASMMFGVDVDKRIITDGNFNGQLIIGNCVKFFEIWEETFPEVYIRNINANPPFGIRWKLKDGSTVDSTEYTWKQMLARSGSRGFGWLMSNYKTIERLEIHKHPNVFAYFKFGPGLWKNCDVEIGVVVWSKEHDTGCQGVTMEFPDVTQVPEAPPNEIQALRPHFRSGYDYNANNSFAKIRTIMAEESGSTPKYNFSMSHWNRLQVYLSTKTQIKNRMTNAEIERLHKLGGRHPMTLVADRESRKIMQRLIEEGVYTMSPEAEKAIKDAIHDVNLLSCPIMPVTDFERVAYTDEEDNLECVGTDGLPFTPGKKYEFTTETYQWSSGFKRNKMHLDKESESMYEVEHHCVLSGKDRMIVVKGDDGFRYSFKQHPSENKKWDVDESRIWNVFKRPQVQTLADRFPDKVEEIRNTLKLCEMTAGFKYYPGQVDYLSNVAVKDCALVGADVGTGKSLAALSLIQIKSPDRALIIAPQGTMKSSRSEDEDEDGETQETASQWVNEIRTFAPNLPVFELFSMEDYERIKRANHGELPYGVFISYFQAMFSNGAKETKTPTWTDEKVYQYAGIDMPHYMKGDEGEPYRKSKCIVDSIGKENKLGIRCIVAPCMATLIGHHFDMVLVDEAHTAQNSKTNVTQMLIRLQPKYRYALTATPIPNILSNIFCLMGWLCVPDWYKGNQRNAAWPYAREDEGAFNDTFLCYERDVTEEEMRRREDPKKNRKCSVVKTSPSISSPALLLKLIKPTMAYMNKKQCNPNMVPVTVHDVRVGFGAQQLKLYKHFLNRANVPHKNPLVRARLHAMYLREICASPATFKHHTKATEELKLKVASNFNPKTAAILSLAKELVDRGEQVTIIASRVAQSDTIHQQLINLGLAVSRIDSTVPPEEHAAQSNLFKSGRTQVMIMGIKCAVGHSFPRCPNLIIGSLEYSYGTFHQACGRAARVNSVYPVNIYVILHKGSIEEVMYDAVATKADAATICLQGKRIPRDFKPVDASEILSAATRAVVENGQDEEECEQQWLAFKNKKVAA